MRPRLLRLGEHAVLVEVDDAAEVVVLAGRLRGLPGVAQGRLEVVPAARTVMVRAVDPADLAQVRALVESGAVGGGPAATDLRATDPAAPDLRASDLAASDLAAAHRQPPDPIGSDPDARASGGPEVVVPVRYDGPDLADVARLTGLDEDEVVLAHTRVVWTVAFIGFAPGFAYLAGGDPRLHVPRRDSPRTSVPAGAVGLAGEWSGIYPRPSPGGWQLLGRTELVLWDVDRDPPALLAPGTRVRFEAT